MEDVNRMLAGSPYLIPVDGPARGRGEALLKNEERIRRKALSAQKRLVDQSSHSARGEFADALRSRQVSESNQIEGIPTQVQDVALIASQYAAELAGPARHFREVLASDPKIYEVLGLFRAHQLAEELSAYDGPMREVDIRELHQVITGDAPYAGRYKTILNQIGGRSDDRPTTPPWDVPRVMQELTAWWNTTEASPLVQAAVVHAWLADTHPFEDGNGRISRILANIALARGGYPPLIISATSDRGQYYDALASSDDGDLLPLLDLFVAVLKRNIETMKNPSYIQDVIDNQFLASNEDRYREWSHAVETLFDLIKSRVNLPSRIQVQGYPSPESFEQLFRRNASGNGWWFKFGDGQAWTRLAWFGFLSVDMRKLVLGDPYPSIFFSRRNRGIDAVHPYSPIPSMEICALPNEMRLRPLQGNPVQLRYGSGVNEYSLERAAKILAEALVQDATSPRLLPD